MLEGIVEDNQVHLFGWVLLVVSLKFIVASLFDGLNIWASLINEWGFSNKLAIFIELIFSLEVSEEMVGHELFIIESEGVSELLFGHSIEHVGEDLLIVVVDKFIYESSVTLMSPERDEEELWHDLLLDVGAVGNNLILWLSCDCADSLEHSCKFTNSESVMELGWGWQESSLDCVPNADGGINQWNSHISDFLGVLLWVEEYLQDSTIDVLNRFLGWWSHVD